MIIRADAGPGVGTGHVMRQWALVQAWRRAGGCAVLAGRCESEKLIRRIREDGVEFVAMDRVHPDADDLKSTLGLARERRASAVVVDGYHFGPDYQQAVRGGGFFLLVMDDYAHLSAYHADVLLNQNIDALHRVYHCDADTRMLMGTSFALLREEFQCEMDEGRNFRLPGKKVLVTLGGGNQAGVMELIVRCLGALGKAGLQVRLVVGPASPQHGRLQEFLAWSACAAEVVVDASDMPGLMSWADVAISASGSTCWELCRMGCPMVVGAVAENQRGIASGLDAAGAAINLGWLSEIQEKHFIAVLSRVLSDGHLRSIMSKRGRGLVDGRGADRVASILWRLSEEIRS